MTRSTLLSALAAAVLLLHAPLAAAENPYVNSTDAQACDDQTVAQIGVREIEACALAHLDTVVTKCGEDSAKRWTCTFHFDLYLTVTGIYACGSAKVVDVVDLISGCGVANDAASAYSPGNYSAEDVTLAGLDPDGGEETYSGLVCASGAGSHTTCVSWSHVVTYPGKAQCQDGSATMAVDVGLDGGSVWVLGTRHQVPGLVEADAAWTPWAARVQAYYDGPSPC